METAVVVRRSVKHLFGLVAVLGCGFVVLSAVRPDVAAQITGAEYNGSGTNGQSFFSSLMSGTTKQRGAIHQTGERSADLHWLKKKSAETTSDTTGNNGKLRKKIRQVGVQQ